MRRFRSLHHSIRAKSSECAEGGLSETQEDIVVDTVTVVKFGVDTEAAMVLAVLESR